jgi:hypothetical protein
MAMGLYDPAFATLTGLYGRTNFPTAGGLDYKDPSR